MLNLNKVHSLLLSLMSKEILSANLIKSPAAPNASLDQMKGYNHSYRSQKNLLRAQIVNQVLLHPWVFFCGGANMVVNNTILPLLSN